MDSELRHVYEDILKVDAPIVWIKLYADGTTIAKSVLQSAYVVQMSPASIALKSNTLHDIDIAPVLVSSTTYSDPHLSTEKSTLLQRYLFLALRDATEEPKRGFMLLGEKHYLRLSMLVCDQKMERSFASLKAARIYCECPSCTMISRPIPGKISG